MLRYNGEYKYLCDKKQEKCEINEFINRLTYFMNLSKDISE
jgi:hypothetical protein